MRYFWPIQWVFYICAQLFLFDGAPAWASSLQTYVICTSPKSSLWVKKWAEHIELALELIDGILIKKCEKEVQRPLQREEVNVFIDIVPKSIDEKDSIHAYVYAQGQVLFQRELHKKSLTKKNARLFLDEITQNLLQQEQIKISNDALEILSSVPPPPQPSESQKEVLKQGKHGLLLSARLGAENSSYQLSSQNEGIAVPAIWTKIYPRIGAEVEWWPYVWMGIKANGAFALSAFRMDVSGIEGLESQLIWSRSYQGETVFKMRYLFQNGFGLGLGLGYWSQGSFVDLQTVKGKVYTQIPSVQLHAFKTGGEFYFHANQKKIDVALLVSMLPFAFYQESPDVPGEKNTTQGMQIEFLFRYFFADNWFISLDLNAVGFYSVFRGGGNRLTVQDEILQGGSLLTHALNTSAGIGWSF